MRQGIRAVAQVPSWLYQKYSLLWKRALLAAGWALLFVLLDASLDGQAFPIQWRVVLAAGIFLAGLWQPVAAYGAFVAASAYPLYQISIYVMALTLAALILGAPLAARHQPLALMVAVAPLLAPIHLTPILPLLAGLWASESSLGRWGRVASTVTGALCALWLKVGAGMAGASVDLWPINGWTMALAPIYERFHSASSLRTVLQLIEPFTTVPGGNAAIVFLFNVLQVLAWAAAAYLVAAVRDVLLFRRMGRAGSGSAWTTALSLVPGLLVVWAGYVAVPSWLQVPGPRWLVPLWLPAQIVLAGAVAMGVDGLMRYLQQPLSAHERPVRVALPREQQRRRAGKRAAISSANAVVRSEAGSSKVALPVQQGTDGSAKAVDRPRVGRKTDDDIIMIDLD